MPEPLFIGIDGGGTNCRARLEDASGKILGEGTGGPANVRLGAGLVMGSILTASRAAAAAGGLAEAELERTYAGLGLAGAFMKSASDKLRAEPNPFASIAIETDAYAAWLGAQGGNDGAILILGTGSCGLAVVGGKSFDVGGYGNEVSDEASAYWIGREAIRRSLWALDGRAPMTPLAKGVLARLGSAGGRIVEFTSAARPAEYGAFAPLVFDSADKGDALALAIVTDAVADAVKMITRLIDLGAPSVALIGGIAEPLEKWLPPEIRGRLSKPKGDALDGAILMARRAYAAAEKAAAHA